MTNGTVLGLLKNMSQEALQYRKYVSKLEIIEGIIFYNTLENSKSNSKSQEIIFMENLNV